MLPTLATWAETVALQTGVLPTLATWAETVATWAETLATWAETVALQTGVLPETVAAGVREQGVAAMAVSLSPSALSMQARASSPVPSPRQQQPMMLPLRGTPRRRRELQPAQQLPLLQPAVAVRRPRPPMLFRQSPLPATRMMSHHPQAPPSPCLVDCSVDKRTSSAVRKTILHMGLARMGQKQNHLACSPTAGHLVSTISHRFQLPQLATHQALARHCCRRHTP